MQTKTAFSVITATAAVFILSVFAADWSGGTINSFRTPFQTLQYWCNAVVTTSANQTVSVRTATPFRDPLHAFNAASALNSDGKYALRVRLDYDSMTNMAVYAIGATANQLTNTWISAMAPIVTNMIHEATNTLDTAIIARGYETKTVSNGVNANVIANINAIATEVAARRLSTNANYTALRTLTRNSTNELSDWAVSEFMPLGDGTFSGAVDLNGQYLYFAGTSGAKMYAYPKIPSGFYPAIDCDSEKFEFVNPATIDFNSTRLTEVGTPTASSDATTKAYVDGSSNDVLNSAYTADAGYIPLNGPSGINGNFTVTGNVLSTSAGAYIYMQGGAPQIIFGNGTPNITLGYNSINDYLMLTGAGVAGGLSMSSSKIISLANGTDAGDAVNMTVLKAYTNLVSNYLSTQLAKLTGATFTGEVKVPTAGLEVGSLQYQIWQNGANALELRSPDSQEYITMSDNGGIYLEPGGGNINVGGGKIQGGAAGVATTDYTIKSQLSGATNVGLNQAIYQSKHISSNFMFYASLPADFSGTHEADEAVAITIKDMNGNTAVAGYSHIVVLKMDNDITFAVTSGGTIINEFDQGTWLCYQVLVAGNTLNVTINEPTNSSEDITSMVMGGVKTDSLTISYP